MNGSSSLPFSSLPGLGEDELPGFSAEECPEEMPDLSKHFSLAAEVLKADRNLYQQMRRKQTSSGVRFAKCIKTGMDNRGHPMIKALGAVAGDAECYDTFRPFFDRLLALCHGEEVLSIQHGYCPARSVAALEPDNVVSCHLRASRNLKDLPFVPHMARAQRSEVERRIVLLLKDFGSYFPLAGSTSFAAKPKGMDAAEEKMLLDSGLLFREPDSPAVLSTGGGRHWPEGRGVFVLEPKDDSSAMSAWINEEEHFKIMVDRKDGNLKQCLLDANRVLRLLESSYGFEQTQRLGYLTSSPMNLGIAMVASYVLRLPKLMEAKKELVDWCKSRDVIARGVLDEQGLRVEGLLEISHRQKIGIRAEEEELRNMIGQQLLLAADDGRLETILTDNMKPMKSDFNELRKCFADELLSASADGRLDTILQAQNQAVSDKERQQMGELLLRAAEDGSLEKALQSKAAASADGLRSQVGAKLLAAAEDGSLERIMREKAAAFADGLRSQVGARLLAAAEDGSLERIMREKADTAAQQLRERMGQSLIAACRDGRLEDALRQHKGPTSLDRMESVRQRTAAKLLAAAEDGRLDRVLANNDNLDSVRQQLAATFLAFAEDGRLERVLSRTSDMDVLRQRVSAQMLAAAEDGRLDVAMQKKDQAQKDLVRGKAAASLLKAAEDGQLESMLAKGNLEDIRSRMAASMSEAAETGRLEEVLRGSKVQEIRMGATMVPWSDVVPDEIRSTDLIAQAHLAAQGQLKIGAQAAQSTLLRYERRIGTLMANIHQAERESLSKSAEAASLEVALQEAVLELRRVEQDLESQKVLMGNEEVRAMQLQDRQRQLMDQLDQETLKVKHARIEWRGAHELAGQ